MKTIDASVKFKATPPAFNEIRKTVTPVFFTKQITVKPRQSASITEKLTEMLDSGISLLRRHATFKAANLAGAYINLLVLMINQVEGETHVESSALQSKSDQVQERHKLREHERFDCAILVSQLLQFFYQRFKL